MIDTAFIKMALAAFAPRPVIPEPPIEWLDHAWFTRRKK